MENPLTVAVIGAGISGVCTAAHLLKHGLSVTVYERSSITGGVWHYDHRAANEPPYPNELPSKGDYEAQDIQDEVSYATPPATPGGRGSPVGSTKEDRAALIISHAPPGPCYAGLMNNVSLTCMKTSLDDWPAGLEEFVSQRYLEEYIQAIAVKHRVNEQIEYDSRVDRVGKVGEKWRVVTTKLHASEARLESKVVYFDRVVVASGHYNMPRIPDVPGLKNLKQLFPDRICHSKGYRDARRYADKTVLLVGAGVSSMDIAKEIVRAGGKVVQSSRGGTFDLPAGMLPDRAARRVEGISSLIYHEKRGQLAESEPLPATILLRNGETLSQIDYIILCTGYITSYPFLPEKHTDILPAQYVTDHVLVSKEGDMTHNLHKDIFYIPDPTLAFVGVPYHISTFSLFDLQAQVVARVFAKEARVPPEERMRVEYRERVVEKGLGREFHSLRAENAEIEYAQDLVDWVNGDLGPGIEPMRGHTEAWLAGHRLQRELLAQRRILKTNSKVVLIS